MKQHAEKCRVAEIEQDCMCDGYHTFDELYDHRITLYIALCKYYWNCTQVENPQVWRSKAHSDGSVWDGWFILGIGTEPGQQITYHLPLNRWEETDFVKTLKQAPEWDGHTSDDVIERLKKL